LRCVKSSERFVLFRSTNFSSLFFDIPLILGIVTHLAAAEASSNGVRSWIATGRRGEVYVAFFNLNQEKTKISAKISDIATALRGKKNLVGASCTSHELWSGKDFGPTKDSVSIQVEPHGPALFVLHCSNA